MMIPISRILPTYPSPKPTFTLTYHLGQNVGLREGYVGSFPETYNDTCFWDTAHLPLPYDNMNTYSSLRAKCWLKGGVCGQFPRNI